MQCSGRNLPNGLLMELTNHVASPRKDWNVLSHGSAILLSHGREHNLSLILQTLSDQGALSRADLARATGLTRVTISELVAELISRSHVIETGQQAGKRPGKPSILVDLNRPGLRIIGVDLSGVVPFRAAIMDLDGTILKSFSSPNRGATREAATTQLLELLDTALEQCDAPVLGIGIGSPGVVTDQGIVVAAEKFDWRGFDLGSAVTQATGINTHILNDADCAILSEHTFGQGSDHMILLRLGRGVGCGVITHNILVRGSDFAAGELGHVRQRAEDTALCSCGEIGCLEAYASIPAIWKALADGEEKGQLNQRVAAYLAGAVAPLLSILDIRNVIFTGTPEIVDQPLAQALREALALRSHTARAENFSLSLSEDPEHLVLRGCAVNVLFHELGIT